MSKLRQTKAGLLIPPSMLKGLTGPVSVRREGDVLFIESERRRMARRRVARMVKNLRRAAMELPGLTQATVAREVAAVRQKRAGHR